MSPGMTTRSAALLSPAAGALVQQVLDDPAAPLSVAVCGPGGYGKTALLRELAACYEAAGVPVSTLWQPAADTSQAGVLLVDDAHLAGDDRLREIARRADEPGARVVVAYRPWPRPAAMPAVIDVLRRHGPVVVLNALTESQVAARCAEMWGTAPEPAWTRSLLTCSGGVPRYLDRLIDGLGDRVPGRGEPAAVTGRSEPPWQAPAAALAPFAAEFDELEADLLTVLLAMEAGAGLSTELVAALLECEAERATALVAAAKATGLPTATGALVPLAQEALTRHGPVAQRIRVRQKLAGWQLARGGSVLALMRPLLDVMPGAGTEDPAIGAPSVALAPQADGADLGAAFLAAGDEALRGDPALAAQLFAAASRAGRPAVARRALATALAGDLGQASLLADEVLRGGPPEQRGEAACVGAAALAHRNHLARAVELYRWATPRLAAGFGAIALVGTGRAEEAGQLLGSSSSEPGDPSAGPPTLLETAAYEMGRGVLDSVGPSPAGALSALVQATELLEPSGAAVLLPDSPAALAALIAVHSAEFGTARTVLDRAIGTGLGGPLFQRRHRLLLAWTAMAQGRHAHAAEQAALAGVPIGVPAPAEGEVDGAGAELQGRDLLFAAALRLGLARRASDLVALRAAWPEAAHALIGQPIDLFTLMPLGEIAICAARLGEQRQVQLALTAADELLSRLGDPVLWSVPLHWIRLHAAFLADDRAAGERHAAALREHRHRNSYAAALATAGQCWLDVLSDRIDPHAVEDAAQAMADLGLAWDGARLAGQAAIRTPDRKAMTSLLDCARSLQARQEPDLPAEAPGRRGTGAEESSRPILSDREQEVATLVLAGLTYKQVADRLYLSAKTVEHHMARIRQKLGSTDRRDLLARLRTLTGAPAEAHPAGESDRRRP
ncbi:helix-turn-helix transcriptional regulator [Actinoplanes sp. NBRC 14428]|nr:helix-turn-helix transcriptional regulator [Actinoplanes sp. NBRC 14428]